MFLFKRRKQIDKLPAEVTEYYQSEKRERVGMAWLLALGTLVATIVFALVLFWSGRWAYRKIANKNGTTSINSPASQSPTSQPPKSTNPVPGTTPTPQPAPTPSPAPATPPRPAPRTTPTPTVAPKPLPNTGATGTITAFFVTTAVATALYQTRLRRKSR